MILLQAILLYFLLYILLYLIIWKNKPFDLQFRMSIIDRWGRFYLYKRGPVRVAVNQREWYFCTVLIGNRLDYGLRQTVFNSGKAC